MNACPCGSEKTFATCCEPFITRKENPKTVKQLVRARFSAYKLGAGTHREFLLRTWHPAAHARINLADLTNDNYVVWKTLDILVAQQQGDKGGVEFKATYSERNGPDKAHHERSLFVRVKGVWYYVEGAVKTEDAEPAQSTANTEST